MISSLELVILLEYVEAQYKLSFFFSDTMGSRCGSSIEHVASGPTIFRRLSFPSDYHLNKEVYVQKSFMPRGLCLG